MRDTSSAEPGDADGWLAILVQSELEDLFRHVRVLYPLTDSGALLHAVFATANSIGVAPDVGPGVWLRQLARREVQRASDDRAKRRQAEAAANGLRGAAQYAGGDTNDLEALIAALGKLDLDEQELLRLSSNEDLDDSELAWILDRDAAEVTEQLDAARIRLRAELSGKNERGRTGNG